MVNAFCFAARDDVIPDGAFQTHEEIPDVHGLSKSCDGGRDEGVWEKGSLSGRAVAGGERVYGDGMYENVARGLHAHSFNQSAVRPLLVSRTYAKQRVARFVTFLVYNENGCG